MHRFLISGLLALTATPALAAPKDPIQIVVSLDQQHMRVFRGTEEIAASNISSGKKGHETPTGVFSVLQKNRHHRSNIYSNAPMPFMQRLTWSGIALHASNSVPRHPASHGCVRMPHDFAGKLFKMATNGAHVIIEDNPRTPRSISHQFLFQPVTIWKQSAKLDPWVNARIERQNFGFVEADNRYPARIFITRRTHKDEIFSVQLMLNKLGFDAGTVDGIMGPTTWKAIARFQETRDLTPNGKIDNALLNKLYKAAGKVRPANGRLLIRSHHKTVFSTQVHLENAEKPLGSHLLTVTDYDKKTNQTNWIGISLEDRVQETVHLKNGKEISPVTDRTNLYETLSRISMSAHDRKQVARLLTAGSSITISDNGISIETGKKGTDFIVLTDPYSESEQTVSGLRKVAG